MPFIGPLKEGESRIPRSGDTQGEECRMPFIGPLKGACPSLCPQKGKTTFFLKIKRGVRHSFLSLFQNRVRLLSFINATLTPQVQHLETYRPRVESSTRVFFLVYCLLNLLSLLYLV